MARDLKSRFENPVVLASIIGGAAAVGVALAGGISGIIGGYFQTKQRPRNAEPRSSLNS